MIWKLLSRCLSHPICEGATAEQWAGVFRVTVEALPAILVPTGTLLQSLPCGRTGGAACRRRVEYRSGGVVYAACGNEPAFCDPITLSDSDLQLYKVSLQTLLRLLRGALSLETDTKQTQPKMPSLVGKAGLRANLKVPVYLLYGRGCHRPAAALSGIDANSPAVLLVPTTTAAARVPAFGKIQVFPMERMFEVSDDCKKLELSGEGEEVWNSWKLEICPKQVDGVFRVVSPPMAKWESLSLRLSDNINAVSYSINCDGQNPVSGRLTAAAMGLEDKHGNFHQGWDILSVILESDEYTFFPFKHPLKRGKKLNNVSAPTAISRLNKQLRDVFGIPGNPIELDSESGGYKAVFRPMPAKEIRGRKRGRHYM